VLCLEGSPSSYSPLSLIATGAAVKFAEDMYSTSCISSVEDSVDDLVYAFEDWEAENYDRSFSDLTQGLISVARAYLACTGQDEGFWDKVKDYFEDVIKVFVPEVVDAYEIIVNGVNVYHDFAGMMHSCNDDVADYITCGADLGDMVHTLWETVNVKRK